MIDSDLRKDLNEVIELAGKMFVELASLAISIACGYIVGKHFHSFGFGFVTYVVLVRLASVHYAILALQEK